MSGKLCWLFPVLMAGCQSLHPACPAPPTAAAPCAPPCPPQEYHVQLPGQKVCVPRQPERGLPERGLPEGAQVAKRVSAAEVLLVPRTVYVPYVQQEAVGVARVNAAQLLRRGERGLETGLSEQEESLAETLRKLQQEREQLKREIQDMGEAIKQERARRETVPQPAPVLCPPPVQYWQPPCPVPMQYGQPPCPPQVHYLQPPGPPQAPGPEPILMPRERR